jgi:hypothetical protein
MASLQSFAIERGERDEVRLLAIVRNDRNSGGAHA